MSTDQKTLNISIIIPTYNEAGNISRFLPELLAVPGAEVIVADGGSSDDTVARAKTMGACVCSAPRSKALQMNAGVQIARGGTLLFLHADTRLVSGFAEKIHQALSQPGVAAGAFRLKIDGKESGLRVIEWLVNIRSRVLQMPYGDQGIFVRTGMFSAVGGFPAIPIMEDFEMVRKLKRKGRIRILLLAATTSPRRWEKLGILRTTFINQIIIIGYLLGVKPQRLAEWYSKAR